MLWPRSNSKIGAHSMARTIRVILALSAIAAAAIVVPAAQAAWSTKLIDGAGATAGCSTRTGDGIGEQAITAVYQSQLNGFYYDYTAGDLRRVVLNGASCPPISVIDGAGGGGGRIAANVGQEPAATTFGGNLHVFYYDRTHGNLRHAWFDGSTWHFEVVDGASTTGGRQNAKVGTWPSTAVLNNKLYVTYVNETSHMIRVATWNGTSWAFQTLDGQGGGGRVSLAATGGKLGFNTTAAVYGSKLHFFYFYEDPFCDPDEGCDIFGAIREARSSNGTSWTFANPAGFPAGGGVGGGINCCHDAQSLTTVPKTPTQRMLVYENFGVHGSEPRDLIWTGTAWSGVGIIEDNFGSADLGFNASAVNFNGTVHVFYEGYGRADFDGPTDATLTGAGWNITQLDSLSLGAPTAATVFNGGIDVLLGKASAPGTFGGNDLVLARGP